MQPSLKIHDFTMYGFKSLFNYAFAFWLHKAQCTKGDVNSLLSNRRMAVLQDILLFKNGKQWTALLESLPTGITGYGFESAELRVEPKEEDAPPLTADLISRDAADVIQFLIRYQPFKSYMQYELVKLYQDETRDIRVYNKLNTGD